MPGSFIDSNVVLYSLSTDATKQRRALDLLAGGALISTQVLGEVANVMRRKLGYELPAIRDVLLRLIADCRLHPLSAATVLRALDVAQRFGFSSGPHAPAWEQAPMLQRHEARGRQSDHDSALRQVSVRPSVVRNVSRLRLGVNQVMLNAGPVLSRRSLSRQVSRG